MSRKSGKFSFGTVETGRVWFSVLTDNGKPVPNWSSPVVNAHTHVFPGAFPPRSEIEIVSIGPSALTWRLHFATIEAFWAMQAKLTKTDTLTVLANIQSHRGTYSDVHGQGYIELPRTTLMALGDEVPEIGGQFEVTATFQRHIDPETGMVVS